MPAVALIEEATLREEPTRERLPRGMQDLARASVVIPASGAVQDRPSRSPRSKTPEARGSRRPRIGPGILIDLRFMLDALIGRGAMGNVYRATDSSNGRQVALKILQPELIEDTDIVARFAIEVQVMRRVHHPNVVDLIGAGHYERLPYIAMEYVGGGSLDAILRATPRRCLGVNRAIELLRMICAGVQAIHDVGAVHGDIKAGNVIIDCAGRAVVGDLGMAVPALPAWRFPAGKTMGTPGYMAPELIVGSLAAPAKAADVYALGVLAYRMLTAHLPFEASTRKELFQLHLTAAPRPPSDLRSDLPTALDRVVLTALHKDPHARFRTPTAFARALLDAVAPGPPRRWMSLSWADRRLPRPRHAKRRLFR